MRAAIGRVFVAAVLLALGPAAAGAQTSTIAGVVKDDSGAVLPGVMVEAASPALIEKVRSAVTDGSGQYKVINLRPGTYSVTFTLPGFQTVRREGIELTSDFTATVNAELKVGAVEESITVTGEAPTVDTQSITTRTVMTREVLDAIPTGRNIQAVGIMIPGTTLAFGGGGALSRDVGGSGSLQQSPLQFRGSADAVQTVDGMRLNNLCANGAYSGVYWNDASFQEFSYITGADSAEMAQGGIRINMVPRDGGNTFRGTIFGNYTTENWASNNLRGNLVGDLTYNPNNRLTDVPRILKIWDFNPSIGGPIKRDRLWFTFTFRHWGVEKTVADSYYDLDPSPFRYVADLSRPGIDDGHIVSRAGRLTWQISSKDKFSYYHDDQSKYRNHWGISANIPPEASAIQVTPTSFVSVSKWTRTQTTRLLFEVGFAIYNQEYTELYQPEVTGLKEKVWSDEAIRQARVYNIFDQATGKQAAAWPNPADHFSELYTWSGSASYVTGSHSFKFGATVGHGIWRLVRRWTGDVQPITYNAGRPISVTLRIPTDRRNGIKADTGIYAQDRWTIKRATINAGVRFDWFIGETLPEELPAGTFNPSVRFERCPDGKNSLQNACVGTVQDWKDISPRLGLAYDLFGTGKTALKVSLARYVNGEQITLADSNNPQSTIVVADTRAWRDLDGNGSPFDANGVIQMNELTPSASSPNFGRIIPTTTTTDPAILDGWHKRPYNWEYTFTIQHELVPRVSVSGGYYRRWFGNQRFTDDLRFDNSDYDGPFCITAPSNPNLPNGGGYQVCGLYDLKPSSLAADRPQRSLIRFSSDFGGETNLYRGFEVNVDARFGNGAFLRGGINASARTFDDCNLLKAGSPQTETYPDGSRACHREYGYRPDIKILGTYPLPWNLQFSATYQFSRGVQAGGAGGTSITASWAVPNAIIAPALGRNLSAGAQSKTVALVREGLVFGDQNLNQLDLRVSRRIRLGRSTLRLDGDLYNAFNSNWPFTVSTTFSTAATATWLRPTNVLQSRFFKVGAQLSF